MKYNININQLALSELTKDMDVTDAAILDYIYVLCNSISEKIEEKRIRNDQGIWTWVDFQTLLDQMPLLRISSRSALSRRILKIEKNEFISILKKRIQGHICLFVKNNRKMDSLLLKSNRPVAENAQDPKKPVAENAPIINTNNTIHNDTIYPQPHTDKKPNPLIELFEAFWSEYPVKQAKATAYQKWMHLTPMIALTIIEDIQKRKKLDRKWLEGYIPMPTTYINQRRWEDELTPDLSYRPKLASGTPHTAGKYKDKSKEIVD